MLLLSACTDNLHVNTIAAVCVTDQYLICPLTWSRHLLHHCFQALMDHGVKVASVLANSFSRRCSYIAESDAHVKEKAIQFGFVLGKWGGETEGEDTEDNERIIRGLTD